MSKKYKYIIGALFGGAVLMFILFFVIGEGKKEYTITFDSSGGSNIESQVVVDGNTVSKPSSPTRENYNFVRWEYQNREYDFNNKVTSDMTLKAIWEEIKEEKYFDVEFIVNGEKKSLSLSQITENDLSTLGFPEKEGYELEWYVNGEVYDFEKPLAVTQEMSIEGKYVKITLYTVKFNSDGGTKVDNQKIKPNEKATEPEAITKYGFIFDGWYLNKDKFDFNTPITKGITLVAKWSEDPNVKRYEVTFDYDDGSEVKKQRIIENEKVTEPKAPTKSGFKFLGWYVGDTKYDFKKTVTSDLAIKAKWEEIIQYTVTFNKDNGTENEIKKVNAGEKVTKPKDPSKSGYTFDGWLYNNKPFDFNTPITSDITLTAHYNLIITYKVKFDTGSGGTRIVDQTIESGKTAKEPNKPTREGYDFVEWRLNGSKYVFSTPVTKDITLVAEWKEKAHTYQMVATKRDEFSPDSILTLYRDNDMNHSIEFTTIFLAGREINPHPAINTNTLKEYLNGAKSIRVKLASGEVTASITFKE